MINPVEGKLLNPSKPPYQARLLKNTRRLFLWSGAWAVTIALTVFGPRFLWHQAVALTLLAIGSNVCVGIGLIVAHKNYLLEIDELQRRVMLNAMGITLGAGLIAGVTFSFMSHYHVIPFKADMAYQWMLMGLTYVVSVAYGNWRYR